MPRPGRASTRPSPTRRATARCTVTGEARWVARRVLPPGLLLGALGILGFSFSLPATKPAVAAVLRAGERPALPFWLAAGAGTAAVVAFAAAGGAQGFEAADLGLLLAVAVCGLGYAEGAVVARDLGATRTICWALVLALPLTIPVAAIAAGGLQASASAWLGFAYVALVSMFLGFFAWYAGLARGGVARIGQVQLAQPVLSLDWAALVLAEAVSGLEAVTAAAVLACVVATQRARA